MVHRCLYGAALGLAGSPLAAQPCREPITLETNTAVLDGSVLAFAVFDSEKPGPGPARLYVVGTFRHASSSAADGLAMWGGDRWLPVAGAPARPGNAMRVFDDAQGRALYFVGRPGIMYRFDGAAWSTVPIPPRDGNPGTGDSPVVFDPDGAGPLRQSLHIVVRYAASVEFLRYDGFSWTPLGSPPFGLFPTLVGYDDDGPGPHPVELYAYTFVTRSSGPAMWVDSWLGRYREGEGWDGILEWGGYGSEAYLEAFTVFDPDGTGPLRARLCVGGHFNTYSLGSNVMAWDGQQWFGFGPGLPGGVKALTGYDPDGPGPERPLLIAGGYFRRPPADGLAVWDGSAWSEFGGGAGPGYVRMGPLREFDEDGVGPQPPSLAVAGNMGQLGGGPVGGFGLWRGDRWVGLHARPRGTVRSLTLFNDGFGRRLFAAGRFERIGLTPAEGLARWNGESWEPVLPGIQSSATIPLPTVLATAVHDDGSGWALYVAGEFERASGAAVSNIARWNGHTWNRVGQTGLQGGPVYALEVHDSDGAGPLPPRLYAGGVFTAADGAPARSLAAWDGAVWSEPAGGVDGMVRTLRSWDDGAGPALFVGGDPMFVGGLPESTVAKLGPAGWMPLPVPTAASRVNAFALHDPGDGHFRLYAIGRLFAKGSHVSAMRLEPSGWEPAIDFYAGEGLSARSVIEAGTRVLYLGTAGAMLRYIHGAWYTIDAGIGQNVRAITPVFDDGQGASIFMATDPTSYELQESSFWRLVPCASCYANCDSSVFPPVLTVGDFICFQQRFAAADPWANCDDSTTVPVLNVADFICFQQRFAAGCP